MRILILIICYYLIPFQLTAQSDSQNILPSLKLEFGETRIINSQRWEFASVIIPTGASLIVNGGSSIFHLIVRDSLVINGRIEARQFSSDERQEVISIPGQSPLILKYSNSNLGGTGGYGGAGGSISGGMGAKGTKDYSGGGGGGGGRSSYRSGVNNYPGKNAIDERGATWGGGNRCGGAGGDGVLRNPNGNGGIVFLEVIGYFDGTNGLVDVSGSDGQNGLAGDQPSSPNSPYGCSSGGGGGGGGAPGGQGGYLVGYFKGTIKNYPGVYTNGGKGGKGGIGPQYSNMGGTNGSNGQPGNHGNVFFFTNK
ncbi:hypothetical protein D7322_21045 [Sphingobacterium puteale]|uniref:Uncharacterized protein n=1 Tax=Sphingobacterium puteale TaxID=2420510 RepID=A0A420VTP5_9SPHI|nr:hypothetical protein [Sphingobacterium puteale]RKO69753.1 hypothetical protein D7322_21045 [Sphingobacterium puteale]